MKTFPAMLLLAVVGRFQLTDFVVDLRTAPRSANEELSVLEDSEQVRLLPPLAPTQNRSQSIAISDVTLDKATYTIGELFEYEYTVRYSGAVAIAFPTSLQPHLFRPTMTDLRVAHLGIVLEGNPTGLAIQAVAFLYGSASVPGTLILLHHNQTVRVKGQGRWTVGSRQSPMPENWSAQVQPVVSVRLSDSPSTALRATSSNLTIQLLRAPQ